MPRTRRHLVIMILIMAGLGAAIYLVPTTFEKRFLTALFEGIAKGRNFDLSETTDFSWTRVCAYPRGTADTVVNGLLGDVGDIRLKDFDAPGMVFIDENLSPRPVVLPLPGYIGVAACWSKPDRIQVAPGALPGDFSLAVAPAD